LLIGTSDPPSAAPRKDFPQPGAGGIRGFDVAESHARARNQNPTLALKRQRTWEEVKDNVKNNQDKWLDPNYKGSK